MLEPIYERLGTRGDNQKFYKNSKRGNVLFSRFCSSLFMPPPPVRSHSLKVKKGVVNDY